MYVHVQSRLDNPGPGKPEKPQSGRKSSGTDFHNVKMYR